MGLENYRRVLANEAFRQAEGNMAQFMLFCLPVLLALSLCMAVLVRQSAHFQRWIKNGFLLPMAIPAASVVVFFRMLFDEKGWLNRTVRTGLAYLRAGILGAVRLLYLEKNWDMT